MHYLKKSLVDLHSSDYPKLNSDNRKRLKLTEAVARSFKKRLKILSDAIRELNHDIKERQSKSQQVQDKIEKEISHLEFVLKEMAKFPLAQVDMIETRRLGLEGELLRLKHQERTEYIKAWSDVSTLKRKRRDFIMEYENLLRTEEMLE